MLDETGGKGRVVQVYRASAKHEVEVMIGADEKKDWLAARGPSRDQSIDSVLRKGKTHKLSVAFVIPVLGIQQMGMLKLPPRGPTLSSVRFAFVTPGPDTPVEALINIIRRGRILQTAILSGTTVAKGAKPKAKDAIKLRLQVIIPGFSELERRRPFDAAMICARQHNGRTMAAGVLDAAPGKAPIVLFEQAMLESAVEGIREILGAFVDEPLSFKGALDSEASVELMRRLAIAGAELYRAMGQKLSDGLPGRDLARLQVVQVDPTALVPIEFVYDLAAPANDARLCKNWRKALDGRRCTSSHHKEAGLGLLKVVCPSGFWSVSKVIERRVDREVEAADLRRGRFGIRVEPSTKRRRLASPRGALCAWSERLNNQVPGTSKRLLSALKAATGQAIAVGTWREWADIIKRKSPPLLVLLSHTTHEAPVSLEIGPEVATGRTSLERRALAQVNHTLVKSRPEDAPLLFLLGCDTAVGDRQLYSFVAGFRDSGAAVVVGTITPVHGELAAAVVQTLVERLAVARKRRGSPLRFGELMRDGRRLLLKNGNLTALSAAAFGDADWLV